MSVNAAMALTFLPGVRNWNTGVSRRDNHASAVTLGRYITHGKTNSSHGKTVKATATRNKPTATELNPRENKLSLKDETGNGGTGNL